MLSCATEWGGLRDAYRVREPDGEAYTHRQTSKKQKRSASAQHSDDDSDGDEPAATSGDAGETGSQEA